MNTVIANKLQNFVLFLMLDPAFLYTNKLLIILNIKADQKSWEV